MVMGILGQSALIVAVTSFSLAITSLSRNIRNKLVLSYALFCSVISVWAFFFFLDRVFGGGAFYKVHLAAHLALVPTGLFCLRLLTRVESRFTSWLFRGSLIYTVLVAILAMTSLGNTPVIRSLSFFSPTFLGIGCAYMILFKIRMGDRARVGFATYALRPFMQGISGKIWIYVVAIIMLLTAVMDHVPKLGEVIPSIGNILLCIYLFIVSEAVIHQRLLNAEALINRLMILIFISASFTMVYTTMVAWIDNAPALFMLNSFIASFIILMIIEPAKKIINWLVVRIFSRKALVFEDKVKQADQDLTGIIDASGMAELTLNFLETCVHIDSATIYVLRSDGTKYKRLRGVRDEQFPNREILAMQPFVDFFNWMKKRGETPVILDKYLETEIERSVSGDLRENFARVLDSLRSFNANIAVPYMQSVGGQHTVLGFVTMHVKQPPAPWDDDWGFLQILYPFFERAALILRNMDVYVQLREKERLATLGEMAAGLAHEIRNPLGAIKGAAQYLQSHGQDIEKVDPQSKAFLQVIIEEVNRLNKVVVQFLDYSKPMGMDTIETDIGNLLEKTVAFFRSAQKTQEQVVPINFELVQPEGGFAAIPRISCAPEQIKQVLVNLVQNAIQAIRTNPPKIGGRISIGATIVRSRVGGAKAQPHEVGIYVEDNGPGIKREHLDKVFIPFFTTSKGGTGLGLPISARIVESHGGRMDVQSGEQGGEDGKLTRFTIYLPLKGNA